ncbi:MAG: glycosyltransferase family 2 protein [Candidatus Kariarchaeaceae archaeon]
MFLPVLNEEVALKKLLPTTTKKFRKVLVIDGHSKDRSVEVARKAGADVIIQQSIGKGNAIREGWIQFLRSKATIACMIDADCTCEEDELLKFIPKIRNYDILLGNRFHKGRPVSMRRLPYFVNWLVSYVISLRIKQRIRDVQSPFWIWKRNAVNILNSGVQASKFELEIDMLLQGNWAGLKIAQVPINYYPRIGKSKFSLKLQLRNLLITPYLMIKFRSGLKNTSRQNH